MSFSTSKRALGRASEEATTDLVDWHLGSEHHAARAWADAKPAPRDSVVWLVIDPFMLDEKFHEADGSSTRHNREALRSLLFEPNGVVPGLASFVPFGLAAHGLPSSLGTSCPQGFLIPAALNQAAQLLATYDEKLAENPHEQLGVASWASLEAISSAIDSQSMPKRNSIIMLKETTQDGLCDNLLSQPGTPRLRSAIQNLATKGASVSIVTSLRSVSDTQGAEQSNREATALHADLAQAGNGRAFAASDGPALLDAIERFVDESVSCEIALEGNVKDGSLCEGEVRLGIELLPCNGANGFRLVDESTLELTGSACDRLRAGSIELSARFPCDAIVLF